MPRWRILPERSRVSTEMRSSMHPIHATADRIEGSLEGALGADGWPNLEVPHSARFRFPVAELKSGNRLQDMEMQRRMDVRRWPEVEVVVGRVSPAGVPGRYRASGEVRARGVSRPFEGEFVIQVGNGRVVIEGEHVFDMRDFNVNPPRFLTMKVEPEVRVRAHLEAVEEV